MKNNISIRVENLGKAYPLNNRNGESYVALRDVAVQSFKSAARLLNPFTLAGQFRKIQRYPLGKPSVGVRDFWALQDVSFEISHGDRVGIIGRNGAGKSTLLKVLSRITEPTTGRVEILGRVASLLEVGTGFHPELTGRENIYLNGAILGMSRQEINYKFDQIVDFAGVEKFLETPVKRYSSGMYVRLAFSVAAHLEPNILIVDEVLAVGDAAFQRKCLGKMENVAEAEGRTVLFVSHQMASIANLCNKCILMESGRVSLTGDSQTVIAAYLNSGQSASSGHTLEGLARQGTGEIRITAISIKNNFDHCTDTVVSGSDFSFDLEYESSTKLPVDLSRVICSIQVLDYLGDPLFVSHNRMTGQPFVGYSSTGTFRLTVYNAPLLEGEYIINFSLIKDGQFIDSVQHAKRFTVESGDFYGTGEVPPSSHGKILINADWSQPAYR